MSGHSTPDHDLLAEISRRSSALGEGLRVLVGRGLDTADLTAAERLVLAEVWHRLGAELQGMCDLAARATARAEGLGFVDGQVFDEPRALDAPTYPKDDS